VLVRARGALAGLALEVEATHHIAHRNLRLRVLVRALATKARVTANITQLEAALHFGRVALNVLIEALVTVTASSRAVEETTLLRLTSLIKVNLLKAHARLTILRHMILHVGLITVAVIVDPVRLRSPKGRDVLGVLLCLLVPLHLQALELLCLKHHHLLIAGSSLLLAHLKQLLLRHRLLRSIHKDKVTPAGSCAV